MTPLALALAFFLAVAWALATPPILRRLREPELDPGEAKLPYAGLATPRFALGTGLWTLALAVPATLALPWPISLPWLVAAGFLALSSTIDLATMFIPRVLVYVGTLATLATAAVTAALTRDAAGLVRSVAGALVLGGFFLAVYEVTARRGGAAFGFSDVRLALLIGALAGWVSWSALWWGAFCGMLAGALVGLVVMARRRTSAGATGPFPYGPCLALGPTLALLLHLT